MLKFQGKAFVKTRCVKQARDVSHLCAHEETRFENFHPSQFLSHGMQAI